MEGIKTYRLEVDEKLWEKFTASLRKKYWEKGITINEGITKLMEEFIKKNEN